MLAEKPAQNLMQATNDVLQQAVNRGITHEVPEELTAALEQNTFIFSGFKTYHELREASLLLKDENGGFKPFERYLSDVQKINNTYNRSYLEAEYNYAVHSTQMAVKWQDFEQDGDRYLLQYRTAHDEKVRATHAALHGVTLPSSDPFWDEYYPPLGWNCRCIVVQVRRGKYAESDSSASIANGRAATEKTPSFRFNPGKQRKCFPDNVSYLKHAGANRKERETTEWNCETIAHKSIKSISKQHPLLQQSYPCEIEGEMREIHFADWGISETAHSMTGRKNLYWIKNEVLNNPEKYFKNARYVRDAEVDSSHNTRKKTLNLKKHFIKYYYAEIQLANGEKAYLNIVKHDDGNFYLYTISKQITTY